MKKNQVLLILVLGLISFYPFIVLPEEPLETEIQTVLSKRFISKKDFPTIDSLLQVIKKERGIEDKEFIKMGCLRVNKTIRSADYPAIEPLISDLIAVANIGIGEYAEIKKMLKKAVIVYRFSKKNDKMLYAYEELWKLEYACSQKNDSIDCGDLDPYLARLQLNKQYDKADSVLCSYKNLCRLKFGEKSHQYLDGIKKKINNYDSWLFSGNLSLNEKRILQENRLKEYSGWVSLNKEINTQESFIFQNALLSYADAFTDSNVRDAYSDDEIEQAQKESLTLLKEWINLKGDTLNLKVSYNRFALYNLFSDLILLNADTVSAKKYASYYRDKIRIIFGKESDEYYNALGEIAICYDNEEKLPVLEEQIALAKKLYGSDDYRYQALLLQKSSLLQVTGDIGSAINTFDSCSGSSDNFMDQISSESTPLITSEEMEALLRSGYAAMNSQYGNFEVSGNINRDLLLKYSKDMDSPISRMQLYSAYQSCLNDYLKTSQQDSVIPFAEEIIPSVTKNAEILTGVITSAAYRVNNKASIDFVNRQLENYPVLKSDEYYPVVLDCLAELYSFSGSYDSALYTVNQAARIRGEDSLSRLKKELYCELVCLQSKDLVNAYNHNNAAGKIIESMNMDVMSCAEYASLLIRGTFEALMLGREELAIANIKKFNSRKTKPEDIKSLLNSSIGSAGSVFGSMQYYGIMDNAYVPLFAEAYWQTGQAEKAETMVVPYIEEQVNLLISSIELAGSTGGLIDLQRLSEELQNITLKWASRLDSEPINSLAYNNLVLTKQMLLNTGENLKEIIAHSDNDLLKQKYAELGAIKNTIDNYNSMGLPVDSLELKRKTLEIQIHVDTKRTGNITSGLKLDWIAIQKELNDSDCAVEFGKSTTLNNEVFYTATVLGSHGQPKTIYIGKESDLASAKDYYKNETLGNLIWGPIINHFKTPGNIYFSPAGLLHLIGLENLQVSGIGLISEKYHLYRLTTTRELLNRSGTHFSSACAFGGLNYNSAGSPTTENTIFNTMRNAEPYSLFDHIINSHTRSGVEYLPGTKDEIDSISQIMEPVIKMRLYTGIEGTEEAFKSLSGTPVSILHIASHGFYWTVEDIRRNNTDFLSLAQNKLVDENDRNMSRSGILLSGANNALLGRNLSESCEDGILTAKEVSQMDLSNTDLVVLSACQTALGEVTGEGVFGLQRGFKMAGVHSILMSLWKVDDKATRLLMTRFYANLTSGKSKRQSLLDAQKYVREYEIVQTIDLNENLTPAQRRRLEKKGGNMKPAYETGRTRPYADPEYWAAFILLDAVN